MTRALVAGMLAGYAIAIPVGAIGTCLMALSARTSLRVGLAAAAGVATADGVYALLAVLGGEALAAQVAPVAGPLRLLAALVLGVLAAQVVTTAVLAYRSGAPPGEPGPLVGRAGRAYATLLALTLANPMTIVYFAALVVGGGAGDLDGVPQLAAFVGGALVASASWQAVLAGGGALLGRVLSGRRGRLLTALVSGAAMGLWALRSLSG